MRLVALPILFSLFTTWIGLQTLQNASATINEQQEIRAEMLCTVDPTQCGQ